MSQDRKNPHVLDPVSSWVGLVDQAPSWWVGLDRVAFRVRLVGEQARMRRASSDEEIAGQAKRAVRQRRQSSERGARWARHNRSDNLKAAR